MADRLVEVTPLLLSLKQLRSVENAAQRVGVTVTLTVYEAGALLDALDLLRRVRDCDSDPTGNGIAIDAETWALICEAADAVENSR